MRRTALPNHPLIPTALPLARSGARTCGAAAAQRRGSAFMRPVVLTTCCLIALACTRAAAETKEFTFPCGGAVAHILGIYDPEESGKAGFTKFLLTVQRGSRSVDVNLGYGYMGVACLDNIEGEALFVFQQYCDGSGCKDLDNFGIVDPRTLEVLLAPTDDNRAKAARILGVLEAPQLYQHPQATWLEHE